MNKELIFMLEERSAEVMLRMIMPKILEEESQIECKYLVFEGKNDLDKKLNRRIKDYQNPNAYFLIIRDKDRGDCKIIKEDLINKIPNSKHQKSLVRIACHELESFYLGDLPAIERGMDINILKFYHKRKYQRPDNLANAKQELQKLTKNKYQPIGGSRAIASHINLAGNNKSYSFNMLINGIKKSIKNIL